MSKLRRLTGFLLIVAFIVGVQMGTHVSRNHYVCTECGIGKDVVVTTLFFYPVFQKDENVSGRAFPGHKHSWAWERSKTHAGIFILIWGQP